MTFPIAVALEHEISISDIERAMNHYLDTVIVHVEQGNWREVRNLMTTIQENGWGISFVLWAKGMKVKNVPLHKLANHPCLTGWLVQDIYDPTLIAMLRATTESGLVQAWQKQIPFTKGVVSSHPESQNWWAWISVDEPETMAKQVFQALLSGADGVCFSRLPFEDDFSERERLKAIGFIATHLRLWKPLLLIRSTFPESWEWRTDEVAGWIWNLRGEECLCLFTTNISSNSLRLNLPFSVREGVRSYGIRFPALVRLPLQRKGEYTTVNFSQPQPINLIWMTSDMGRVQKLHHYANELLPKAMQFAVQWALERRGRMIRDGESLPEIDSLIWSMLQNAKRRKFSYGYLTACQILMILGALPTPGTLKLSELCEQRFCREGQ